ncbi:MAG: hypothetical protein ACI4UE_04390 [Candidatus Scatovivens sp.]
MSKTSEEKIVFNVPDGKKIKRVNVKNDGKELEVFTVNENEQEKENVQELLDEVFPIVEASKLSFLDAFLLHQPKTLNQKKFKAELEEIIKSGIEDFRKPIYDPSFGEGEEEILFIPDAIAAVKFSPDSWKKLSKKIKAEKKSRLGTRKQYVAFLGVLIKMLISEKGYEISEAWKAVCDDSSKLGHYFNSWCAKRNFEPTGCRKVVYWYDLANTTKIILDDESDELLLAAGNFYTYGNKNPLYHFETINHIFAKSDFSVGWIIMDV